MPDPDINSEAVAESFACKYTPCTQPIEGICPSCHEPFCKIHSAEIDPAYCIDCLTAAKVQIDRAPLIDAEGVTHNGVQITVSGPVFKTSAQRISEMDDDQLAIHIDEVKTRIKHWEVALQYARIDLSMAELESEERQEKLRRKLRGVKVSATGTKIGAAAGNGSKPKLDPIQMLAKSMGVPPERAMEFFKALSEASKKNKEKK